MFSFFFNLYFLSKIRRKIRPRISTKVQIFLTQSYIFIKIQDFDKKIQFFDHDSNFFFAKIRF